MRTPKEETIQRDVQEQLTDNEEEEKEGLSTHVRKKCTQIGTSHAHQPHWQNNASYFTWTRSCQVDKKLKTSKPTNPIHRQRTIIMTKLCQRS